ncbi:O-antigen ligase family protein [Phenylobacterium sp. J367]|uniref:O-antigen ligase family protein n=1 Tax=Phenylobacterium sp. J367 TaxID=2898435 RepID=UPI0021517002|nr:O-antigen ligase family protein [Phenylobacterium sp. J367]MCR5880881.1 O-antigen ligase family protein [Phenylobacterium sp. J367]
MTTWDTFAPDNRPRRIRGGDIPAPHPVRWREQRRAQAAQATPPAAGDARHGPSVTVLGLRIDLDALFTFGLFVALLFIANWGTLGAVAVAAAVPAYLFVRRRGLERVLLSRAALFAIPALAVFSTVWSEAPKETLKFAIELGITAVAGVLISSARSQQAVMRAMACAFLTYIAFALVTGGTVAIGVGAGGSAFSGLTESKNLTADIASTGVLVFLGMTFMALRDRAWAWVGLGVVGLALGLYSVTAARSAGALIGLAMGVGGMLALLPLLKAGKAVRAWLTVMTGTVLVAIGLSYTWLSQALIEWGARTFDKDPTLTGRTYLWYRAADLMHEKPLLGRGYYAFWLQGNPDAEGLWKYFGIDSRGGFTFHNTFVEILVTLGLVGLVVIAVTVAVGVFALVRRFVLRPNLALVFWVGVLLYQLSRTGIETIGIAPFYFSTVLAFGALGAAFGRLGAPKPVAAPRLTRRDRIVQVWPVEQVPAGWGTPRLRPQSDHLRLIRSDTRG